MENLTNWSLWLLASKSLLKMAEFWIAPTALFGLWVYLDSNRGRVKMKRILKPIRVHYKTLCLSFWRSMGILMALRIVDDAKIEYRDSFDLYIATIKLEIATLNFKYNSKSLISMGMHDGALEVLENALRGEITECFT